MTFAVSRPMLRSRLNSSRSSGQSEMEIGFESGERRRISIHQRLSKRIVRSDGRFNDLVIVTSPRVFISKPGRCRSDHGLCLPRYTDALPLSNGSEARLPQAAGSAVPLTSCSEGISATPAPALSARPGTFSPARRSRFSFSKNPPALQSAMPKVCRLSSSSARAMGAPPVLKLARYPSMIASHASGSAISARPPLPRF